MNDFGWGPDIEKGLALADRVAAKYRPVFDSLLDRERAALAFYFLPHGSKKETLEVTRPRVLKWYCPFADQRFFSSGHRYCLNVYTGCSHRCQYCYAAGYVAAAPHRKDNFRSDLLKDLDALDAYDVPPAPVHLSNSTDPLQPLEAAHGDCLFALEQLAQHRHRFTTVVVLTKNPAMLTEDRYLAALHALNAPASDPPRLRLEISLAFWSDAARQLLDPAAPDIFNRMAAIRQLRENGLPVDVRIDPLFPRDPLPDGKTMADFGLPNVQPIEDLAKLVDFCREVGARQIIYSTAKITKPRLGGLSDAMQKMKEVYSHLAHPHALTFRGGTWRLPDDVVAQNVISPFLALCRERQMSALHCMANLLSTR